jgi:hypothetical protein
MIWTSRLTDFAKDLIEIDKKKWHIWFAWRPVITGIINQGTADERYRKSWLIFVERRGEFAGYWGGSSWEWEYRLINGR